MTLENIKQAFSIKTSESDDSSFYWNYVCSDLEIDNPLSPLVDEIKNNSKTNKFGSVPKILSDYDPLADTLEVNSKNTFIEADKAYFAKTSKHIDINQGDTEEGNARRSCSRQAQLWISWKLMNLPGFAPANLPGTSHHNYGLSVDVIGINPVLKEIFYEYGWVDDKPDENWHFTNYSSPIFEKVEESINKLRNGLAGLWASEFGKAFDLGKKKNELLKELNTRKFRFENEVAAFNNQAKIFNDAKRLFHQQTDQFPVQRDELLSKIGSVSIKIERLENLFNDFVNVSNQVIFALTEISEEIRRLLALPIDQLTKELIKYLPKVPKELEQRYTLVKRQYESLANITREELNQIQQLQQRYSNSMQPFERRAIELLKEYEFLREMRRKLSLEKESIEKGYINVQLMGQEEMYLLGVAAKILESIQIEVNYISPSN